MTFFSNDKNNRIDEIKLQCSSNIIPGVEGSVCKLVHTSGQIPISRFYSHLYRCISLCRQNVHYLYFNKTVYGCFRFARRNNVYLPVLQVRTIYRYEGETCHFIYPEHILFDVLCIVDILGIIASDGFITTLLKGRL